MSLDAKVSALTASLKSEFWKSWDQVAEPAPWEQFTTIVPSTTKIENYVNFTPIPGFQRWAGHRNYGKVDSFIYSVRNETWTDGIQAALEDIEDDQTGGLAAQAKELPRKGKLFPGRMVLKLLGTAVGSSIALQSPVGSTVNAFDNLPFFANRAAGGSGFGTGNNMLQFTCAGGTGVNNLVAMYYGQSMLKPLCWQNRSGPDFETNSGSQQSKEARQVRWWCDLRGAPFFGWWPHAVWMQITGLPNVAEVHSIFAAIESAFRTFTWPKTISTEDGEYVHEQTVFSSDNLYFAASTALGEVLRQALTQDWAPQSIGATTVATTNSYKGFGKHVLSAFLNA